MAFIKKMMVLVADYCKKASKKACFLQKIKSLYNGFSSYYTHVFLLKLNLFLNKLLQLQFG